jgi:NADPH2 dehydrogenase
LPWNFVCRTEVQFQPDLPYRLIHDVALAVGDRALYYAPGSVDPKGYTDYTFASPVVEAQA